MAPRSTAVLASASLLATLAGCGQGTHNGAGPALGLSSQQPAAARQLGFPDFATKNTTRVGGSDPTADAAAVARAVFPSTSPATRPSAVAIADAGDWRGALAATALMGAPLRAPLLLSAGSRLPPASADELGALAPAGSTPAGGAQTISVGGAARPGGLRNAQIIGRDPFVLAADIDAFVSRARGVPSDAVVVVSANAPEYAMPAAAWAAKSGNPILYVTRDAVPDPTRVALATHQHPRIYLLGPGSAVSEKAVAALRTLGTVRRIRGLDPVTNSIAFARFIDGSFGWGAVDPGHGLVFVNVRRPLDAAAAAPLSASGTYGPLLITDRADPLAPPIDQYLLDIQPGYTRDPVRGVYNHGWVIGDEQAISVPTQGRIDADLEIVPVNRKTAASLPPPTPAVPATSTPTSAAPTATAPVSAGAPHRPRRKP